MCAVQTRDNTYSGRARFPAPFNTANTWPTPTPSTTPSASPDLSKFGRLSAPAAAPAAAADPTGAIVGGIIGGLAFIALVAMWRFSVTKTGPFAEGMTFMTWVTCKGPHSVVVGAK